MDKLFQSPSSHAFFLAKPLDDYDFAVFRICKIRPLYEDVISVQYVPFNHGVPLDPSREKTRTVSPFSPHVVVSDAVSKVVLRR